VSVELSHLAGGLVKATPMRPGLVGDFAVAAKEPDPLLQIGQRQIVVAERGAVSSFRSPLGPEGER
jgi:hypothetical protein